ncbi:MAG: hypothetical protein AAGA54_04190 [Myxococcota bacterium]
MALFSRKRDPEGPPRGGLGRELAFPPAMSPEEQSQVSAVFAAVRPARVIEWGSGGSTLLLPALYDTIEQYVSVEHNKAWHARVEQHIDASRVEVLFRPPAEADPEPPMFKEGGKGKTLPEYAEWSDRAERDRSIMASYIDAPFERIATPDLTLVDGRARRFCIEAAWSALPSGGVLVVHDAQRGQYIEKIEEVCDGRAEWMLPWSRGQVCVARKP